MEKKKFKKMGRGVYISLAICMLIIAAIGIFASVRSISKMMDKNAEEFDELSQSGNVSNYFPLDNTPVVSLPTLTDDAPTTLPDDEKEEIVIVWTKPVEGEVQKDFSNGELFYSETMNDYRTHNGVDIKAESGEAVVSVGPGMISAVTDDPLWGMSVTVDHGNGITTVYRNLSETLPVGIESGAYVEQGGVLGAVSTSALVEIGEDSHLHFEVWSNGVAVDPLETLSIYK